METIPRRRGRPTDPRLAALDDCLVAIVEEHGKIQVRGVFYQAVKLGLVQKTENQCDLIGRRLLKLRREGRIPYERIVDESRIVYGNQRFAGLAGLAEEAATLYRRDYWAHSNVNVQIWVEKRGLAGLLTPTVCNWWGLDLYVAAGQMSETYLYVAGNEIKEICKHTYVYALTDFDPGGVTIYNTLANGSKKAPGGLARFTGGVPVKVRQLALTRAQVARWKLPTRPANRGDTRSPDFIEKHGDISVELDAIEPAKLIDLVSKAIARHFDPGELHRLRQVEKAERESVRHVLAVLAGTEEPHTEDADDDDLN
jgi:hypothetical protein